MLLHHSTVCPVATKHKQPLTIHMLAIFLKNTAFFSRWIRVLGLLGRAHTVLTRMKATAYLDQVRLLFALSAMLFAFLPNLSLAEVWDTRLVALSVGKQVRSMASPTLGPAFFGAGL